MRKITVLLAALLLALLGTVRPASAAAPDPADVAHRGGNEVHTENTRRAFSDAMAHGAQWLETDVRFTSDDYPVIMHDPTVDRTTDGTGNVADMTLAQLRALRTPDGQYVPTLYEFLSDLEAHAGVRAFTELKVVPTTAQWTTFDERYTWLAATADTVVTSFDKTMLTPIRDHGHTPGWIDGLGDRDPAEITPYTSYYLKHQWSVTWDRAHKWAAAGLQVFPWTADAPADWDRFRSDGVAGVITNTPDAYAVWSG